MAKVVLGKRPESFKRTLKFSMVDGTEGQMEVEYRYRTLTEFGEFIDQWDANAKALLAADKVKRDADRAAAEAAGESYVEPTNQELRRAQAEANADYLFRILTGWNLDVKFELDAIIQLCDEIPAAANEAMNTYRIAITEGRLGN